MQDLRKSGLEELTCPVFPDHGLVESGSRVGG